MKATIKMLEREYAGELKAVYDAGWFWEFRPAEGDGHPFMSSYDYSYGYLGNNMPISSETEALADARAHGITIESEGE